MGLYALISDWPLVRRYPIIRQYIKFCFVGLGNTSVDFVVYFVLTRNVNFFAVNYLLAQVAAFILAVTFSFTMNRSWTFRISALHAIPRQYSRFFLVMLVSLGLYSLLLYMLVSLLGIYDLVAKLFLVVVMSVWNFLWTKFWTFRKV